MQPHSAPYSISRHRTSRTLPLGSTPHRREMTVRLCCVRYTLPQTFGKGSEKKVKCKIFFRRGRAARVVLGHRVQKTHSWTHVSKPKTDTLSDIAADVVVGGGAWTPCPKNTLLDTCVQNTKTLCLLLYSTAYRFWLRSEATRSSDAAKL